MQASDLCIDTILSLLSLSLPCLESVRGCANHELLFGGGAFGFALDTALAAVLGFGTLGFRALVDALADAGFVGRILLGPFHYGIHVFGLGGRDHPQEGCGTRGKKGGSCGFLPCRHPTMMTILVLKGGNEEQEPPA